MKQVAITELQSRLTEYINAVRDGETISVMDHDKRVAQIVPVRKERALQSIKPKPGAPPFNEVPLPEPLGLDIDIMHLLLEERQNHR